jgi:hypothetical protein
MIGGQMVIARLSPRRRVDMCRWVEGRYFRYFDLGFLVSAAQTPANIKDVVTPKTANRANSEWSIVVNG